MTALELLKVGRARIAKPEAWTQRTYARNTQGQPCQPDSPVAVSWCALGALGLDEESYLWAAGALLRTVGGAVGPFNDSHTHAEVLAVYDRAIATLEGTGNGEQGTVPAGAAP